MLVLGRIQCRLKSMCTNGGEGFEIKKSEQIYFMDDPQ